MDPFLGHIWLIINAHSKWLEVYKMSSTTSTATIQCLRDIFARFGLPERIVTDNVPNFTSAEFSYFLKQNGIKQTTYAPYHPASEQAVKIFKIATKKMTVGSLQNLLDFIPLQNNSTINHRSKSISTANELRIEVSFTFA